MVLSFLENYQSSFTHSYRPGRGQSFTGSKLYLSMKACCCGCSAAEKNSFISAEHGIIWRAGACTLRWEFEWLGLVVDPGVLIVPESLIKLQGVVSLVPLPMASDSSTFSPKDTSSASASASTRSAAAALLLAGGGGGGSFSSFRLLSSRYSPWSLATAAPCGCLCIASARARVRTPSGAAATSMTATSPETLGLRMYLPMRGAARARVWAPLGAPGGFKRGAGKLVGGAGSDEARE